MEYVVFLFLIKAQVPSPNPKFTHMTYPKYRCSFCVYSCNVFRSTTVSACLLAVYINPELACFRSLLDLHMDVENSRRIVATKNNEEVLICRTLQPSPIRALDAILRRLIVNTPLRPTTLRYQKIQKESGRCFCVKNQS